MAALGAIVSAVVEARVDAEDVTVRRPMLDEVFLQLTVLMAVLWPLVIVAVFAPLSIRRYRDLSR